MTILPRSTLISLLAAVLILCMIGGCRNEPRSDPPTPNPPKTPAAKSTQTLKTVQKNNRRGKEIAVCGQLIDADTDVVLWFDPGGYDAYKLEKHFVPDAPPTKPRYGPRKPKLDQVDLQQIQQRGWSLPLLQRAVDQFVIHYDVCGTSRQCFKILHDIRGLSVHFMLDIDGTIYQTLDLKERAWHATISNDRSIGIEIANIGAYPIRQPDTLPATLTKWYRRDETGRNRITLPQWMKATGVRTPDFIGRPIRDQAVAGRVQGTVLSQYDLTPQQYEALIRLTATLCRVFPKLKCDYPRDKDGNLLTKVLTPQQWKDFGGVIGHYHIQKNKVDPGPAFQWDRVIQGARDINNAEAR